MKSGLLIDVRSDSYGKYQSFQKQMPDRQIINWRDEANESKAMLARLGNPFIHIGFDPQSNVAMDWGVYGAPETFLIDAEGMIRAKHAGAMTPQVWEEKFRPYFDKGSSNL